MKKTILGATISRKVLIDSYWRCESFKKEIPKEFAVALEESAMNRIYEMIKEGYCSGQLNDNIFIDIPGRRTPKDGWECNGWWNIQNQDEPQPKLNTVNVIEVRGDVFGIQSMASFTDDEEGNSLAEARFKSLVTENHKVSKADIEVSIENGYFQEGEWIVLLTHSTE